MSMNISEQLEIVQTIFKKQIFVVYQREFFLKLIAVMREDSQNSKWFKEQLSKIDGLSELIETSIMSSNPRRASKYLLVLNNTINQLGRRVDSVYSDTLKFEKHIMKFEKIRR